jgi:hypothetical protein
MIAEEDYDAGEKLEARLESLRRHARGIEHYLSTKESRMNKVLVRFRKLASQMI